MLAAATAPYLNKTMTESVDMLYEWRKAIGKELADLRDETGVGQEEMAEALGVTRGTISNIERGKSNTPINTLLNYCLVLSDQFGVDANFGLLCARAAFVVKAKTLDFQQL